jgi:Protein of unknown function (DUF3223)
MSVPDSSATRKRLWVIGPRTFRTQAEAYRGVQQLIATHANQGPIEGEDALVLAALVARHPQAAEKIGPGIAYFYVCTDPDWPKSSQLRLVHCDGSVAVISWNACLQRRPRHHHVNEALRRAVDAQVRAARWAAFVNPTGRCQCPYTGAVLTIDSAHVDHAPPGEFALLVKAWLAHAGLTFQDILTSPAVPPQTGHRMADRQQRLAWEDFHRRYARLQVISPEANLRLRRQRKATLVELGQWALSHGDMRLVQAVNVAIAREGVGHA